MEKIFDTWNEVKKQTDEKPPSTGIKVGEIRWCRFGINIGKEIMGKGETFKRPVLILKKYSGDGFLGLPLTSQSHTGDWYYGLIQKELYGYVILNQGRTLDRKRLEDKIIEVSEAELNDIKKAYCDLILKP
jgi:mRNA interferase MazF